MSVEALPLHPDQQSFHQAQLRIAVSTLEGLLDVIPADQRDRVHAALRALAAPAPAFPAPSLPPSDADVDYGYEAHKAAMAHLAACSDAMYESEEIEDPALWPESPAVGPYCGCDDCVVREVLAAAWPIFERSVQQATS